TIPDVAPSPAPPRRSLAIPPPRTAVPSPADGNARLPSPAPRIEPATCPPAHPAGPTPAPPRRPLHCIPAPPLPVGSPRQRPRAVSAMPAPLRSREHTTNLASPAASADGSARRGCPTSTGLTHCLVWQRSAPRSSLWLGPPPVR